jgi:hypothetical protein
MEFSVQIDESNLDREWIEHPKNFYKAAKALATKKNELAIAKAFLDVEEAEVELDVRSDPAKYKIKDVKEGAIKLRITLHTRVRNAIQSVNEVKHELDIMQARVDALEHKKRALENLVALHGQNYFSSPRQKGVDAEMVRESVRNRQKERKKSRS